MPELLSQAAKMFERADDLDTALSLVDRARSLISATLQPLDTARLLCDWSDLALYAGRLDSSPLTKRSGRWLSASPTPTRLNTRELSRAHPRLTLGAGTGASA